jgi:hypothetical protein
LSSIAVDPQFTENRTVFMTEIQSNGEGPKIRLSRYRDVADVLGERAVLLEAPLSTPPSRTALTVGADKLLHIALLVSPDSEPSHAEHLFVIRVDENGRVPPDNPGASMFDRPTASAPVAVAWNGNAREPWVVEEIRRGRYLVKPAMLELRERHNFDSAGPPAAIQLVDKDGKPRLFSVDRNGEILTMDLVDGEWAIRGRTPLVTGLQSVQDFLMFGDGEVFVCGSTGAGGYGIWRGRPPL